MLAKPPAGRGACPTCGARLLRPRYTEDGQLRTLDQLRAWGLEHMRAMHARDLASAIDRPGLFATATIVLTDHREPCATCAADANRVCAIDDVLRTQPLPHAGCTCVDRDGVQGVCGCWWALSDERPASSCVR